MGRSCPQAVDGDAGPRRVTLRVLITVPSLDPRFGGPVAKVRGLARALFTNGVDARVVGCGSATWAFGLPPIASYHGSPLPRSLGSLRSLVRQSDITHVVGFRDPVGRAAIREAARAHKPVVFEPAGMFTRRGRSMLLKTAYDSSAGRAYRSAALVVATSNIEADELRTVGIDPDRILVRPNGVDIDEPVAVRVGIGFRAVWGIPPKAPLVLALGRIAKVKNLAMLVRAASSLGAWLAIVGPDSGDESPRFD